MFLTSNELRELTGYAYHSKQIEWLRQNNWKFEVTAQLRPKVARSYFEFRMGVPSVNKTVEPVHLAVRPNFQAINQR